MTTIACSHCDDTPKAAKAASKAKPKKDGSAKLPRGWKRHNGETGWTALAAPDRSPNAA